MVGDGKGAWEWDGKGAEGIVVDDDALVAEEAVDPTLEVEFWKAEVDVDDEDVGKAGYRGLWDDRRSMIS